MQPRELNAVTLPFISVIIAHLNQPETLRHCLASLAGQAYPRDSYEVIVVDNGSSQSPAPIIAEFGGVRLEHEATPGPGPARNRGAAVALGEVLAFIDADEIAERSWLLTIGRRLARQDAARVLGGDVRIAYRNPDHLTMLEAYESVFAYRQKEYIERHGFTGTGNLAVRRADFKKIGGFPGIGLAEDRMWGRQARANGYRITYVPEMVAFTPARHTPAELKLKWDRHILHDFEEWRGDGRSIFAWVARAVAVAASSVLDVRRIVTSPRVWGIGPRVRAFGVLFAIRLYRAGVMLRVAAKPSMTAGVHSWNRPAAL